MRSECMDMETISCIALFDELEKIAEDQRKYITKDVYKRHLQAAAIVGAGMGIGTGLGKMTSRALDKNKGRIGTYLKQHPTAVKLAPAAIGALVAAPLALRVLHSKSSMDYREKGRK